jgi:glycosyltransferase involved in cell wall biosynthesis
VRIGVSTFGCDRGRSGIGRYLICLLREFAAAPNGDHCEVLMCEEDREAFLPPEAGRVSPVCLTNSLRRPLVNLAWHQAALPGWCRRRGYDALFLPAGNRRVPLWSPCPAVGTVHDLASLHVRGKYDPARTLYVTRLLPRLIRRLSRVIAVSESGKRDIVEGAGVPEERVVVIPQGVDHGRYFPRDGEEARARVCPRYGIRPPYILYVSRLEHPGKNHVRLIRAFARLKASGRFPHGLVLAGPDSARAEEVRRAASASPCAAQVAFAGFVPEEDLPDLYAGAELLAFPSLYEGFGLPVLEAMACGVPVACSNTSSLPEVAAGAAVLFDPGDEDAIAEALEKLLADAELRSACARRGIQRSRAFTWSATATRTLAVIREAAEERGQG